MASDLSRLLGREQRAFLRRDRSAWKPHLERVRAFLGQGLNAADPGPPVLVLGAGSGLEVPWELAPPQTIGWDAAPSSRLRTFLRHGRWAPWVFEDLTGGLDEMARTARRCLRQSWSGRARPGDVAAKRLAGLLPSLHPAAEPLRDWIPMHGPGTILAANVLGQLGAVAQAVVERAFGRHSPWREDPELADPLAEALDVWTARAVRGLLEALDASGAELWMVHDRGVVFGAAPLRLGPWREPWTAQLEGAPGFDVLDPLCCVEVPAQLPRYRVESRERWIWELAPEQRHVVEALHLRPSR